MEPTQQDIAAVNAHLTGNPAPQPQPAPQPTQPTEPTQQPTQPTEPVAPPTPQPQQPTEPSQPAQPNQSNEPGDPFATLFTQEAVQPTPPQQPAQLQQTAQPTAQPTQPNGEDYQSFDDYIKSITGEPQQQPNTPNLAELNQDDPQAIQQFFEQWGESIYQRATSDVRREFALRAKEEQVWNEAFEKYPSIKSNKNLRDMIHNIRMGSFNRGVAMTPVQAAEQLLKGMNMQYRQGMADQQVQTTIQSTQPNGGGGVEVIPQQPGGNTSLVQAAQGNEADLVAALDAQIKAGNL